MSKSIWILLIVLLLALALSTSHPLWPALSARVAPSGWEGEAIVGSTAIAMAEIHARSMTVAIIGLVVVAGLGLLALATITLALINRSEIAESKLRSIPYRKEVQNVPIAPSNFESQPNAWKLDEWA